jgi:hypothetical protein
VRAEIDPAILANWSPPPPLPPRPIDGGPASPPFPPVEAQVTAKPETVPADDIIYPPTVTYTEPPKRRQSRPKAKTKIGRAVETNRAPLVLAARTFLALVEERLLALRLEHDRLNSDDEKELAAAQIADYEDLKQRISVFCKSFQRAQAMKTRSSRPQPRSRKVYAIGGTAIMSQFAIGHSIEFPLAQR